MKTSKTKKPKKTAEEIDALKSDVASFASSLGLSTTLPPTSATGFDDSDFRKTGPLKPRHQTPPNKNEKNNTINPEQNPKFKSNNSKPMPQPRARARAQAQAQFDNDNDNDNNLWKAKDKYKNLPKLPLVKASGLGVWNVDAAELEEKVIGGEGKKRIEIRNVEKWKGLVEKNKELGERLLAQYVKDYESSRGQSGDIKMLIATQRSGTAADKVSAYSVLLGDNPVANLRSLDALLGNLNCTI